MQLLAAFWALLLSATFALPSLAAEPVVAGNPNPSTDMLMRATPGTSGVFEPQPDESVRHVQSGFVCPPKLPNANLWALMIFPSPLGPGSDVGCSYGRARVTQSSRDVEAKFTIFVVKAPTDTTLEAAFTRYREEGHRTAPNARILGEAIHLDDKSARSGRLLPVRSEETERLIGNRRFIDQLLVGLAESWIVKVRATYPAEFGPNDSTAGIDVPATAFVWTTAVRAFAQSAAR
jgi:hypothetical protein